MPGTTYPAEPTALLPGLVVLKLAPRGTAGDVKSKQLPAFTRIATPYTTSSLKLCGRASPGVQQSTNFGGPTSQQQGLSLTDLQQHNQQQHPPDHVRLQDLQQQPAGTAHSWYTASTSPSRIPAAPARTASHVSTRPARCSSQPAAASASAQSAVSSTRASMDRTAANQQTSTENVYLGAPAMQVLAGKAHNCNPHDSGTGCTMPHSPPAISSKAGSSDAAHTHAVVPLRSTANNCSQPEANGTSSPRKACENSNGSSCQISSLGSSCSKQQHSPRRTAAGSNLRAAAAHNSNSGIGVHLHHSVAALLAQAPATTPGIQQHKDRRRAELYALNAILARSDELRVKAFLAEQQQQQQQQQQQLTNNVQRQSDVSSAVDNMIHGI